MTQPVFVDHYEVLQLSQNAESDTIDRVYRLMAKRFHPDNPASGDIDRFNAVRRAYEVLSSPERRAEYDVTYDTEKSVQWQIFDRQAADDSAEQDRRLFHAILSLLYVARRRDPEGGGMGPVHLERMLGTPREHLEFPLWYLRQRGWVEALDNGLLAISVEGIDKLGSKELALPHERLLTETASQSSDPSPELRQDNAPRDGQIPGSRSVKAS